MSSLSFLNKQQLSNDIYSFYFQKPKNFDFLPGQYLKLYFGADHRSFTIASSPTENHIMITTKLRQSPFKQKMLNLQKKDQVAIEGPMGGFYLKKEIKDYIFLSGGMGITPFRSMIKFVAEQKLNNNITLFASFTNAKDLIFFEELRLHKSHQNIQTIFTITKRHSDPANFGEESFEQGRLSAKMIKKYVTNILKPHYMIVGPPEFVASMENEVDELGVNLDQIQIESFTGY